MDSIKIRGYELAAQSIPWASLSEPAEFNGALTLLFKQDRDIAVVVLLDENHFSVVASIFEDESAAGKHPVMNRELLAAFYTGLPFEALEQGTAARAPAFANDAGSQALVRFAIPVQGRDGKPWAIAVAWSLRGLCQAILRERGGLRASLLDESGRYLCAAPGATGPADGALFTHPEHRL